MWIDPLDGTYNFIKGDIAAVTVLIGVSIKGKSRIGIVHRPFSTDDANKGTTMFGTIEHGVFKLNYTSKMNELELNNRELEYIEPFDHC